MVFWRGPAALDGRQSRTCAIIRWPRVGPPRSRSKGGRFGGHCRRILSVFWREQTAVRSETARTRVVTSSSYRSPTVSSSRPAPDCDLEGNDSSLPQLHIQAASASDDAMMHTPAPTVMTTSHSSPRRDISTLNVSAPELPTVSTQDVAPDRADSVATGSPSPDFGSTQPATNGKKRKRVSDVDISLDSTALPTPLAGSKRQRTSPAKKASVAQEVTMDVDSHSTISPLVPTKPAKLIKPRKSREVADLESLAKAFEDQDNSLASAKTGTPASLADVDEPTYSVTGRRRRATRKDPLEPPDAVDSPAFSLYKSPLVQEAIEPLDESTPAPSVRPTNDDTNVHTADDVIPPDEVQRASVQEPVAESLPVAEAPALLRIKIQPLSRGDVRVEERRDQIA
ncbi:hypothetical protein BKA62DRAFT_256103 [Auriculariales sp. MPI-PUGE-AT-0066]|nr:hypothetical protein BKA62DRAFT_256103 [Auriculariales sp. MPI-PUGE-AT-0066]